MDAGVTGDALQPVTRLCHFQAATCSDRRLGDRPGGYSARPGTRSGTLVLACCPSLRLEAYENSGTSADRGQWNPIYRAR